MSAADWRLVLTADQRLNAAALLQDVCGVLKVLIDDLQILTRPPVTTFGETARVIEGLSAEIAIDISGGGDGS